MDNANRGVLIVLGILVMVVLAVPVLGGGMMGPGMMWGGGPAAAGGWTWGLGMGLGWLMMLAFWGALIVGVVALVRWLGGTADRSRSPAAAESALDILKRRYAAGELTAEQYQQMKEVLEH